MSIAKKSWVVKSLTSPILRIKLIRKIGGVIVCAKRYEKRMLILRDWKLGNYVDERVAIPRDWNVT